jgi:hypothetical protein
MNFEKKKLELETLFAKLARLKKQEATNRSEMNALQNPLEMKVARVPSSNGGRIDHEQRELEDEEDQKTIKELNEQLQLNIVEMGENKVRIRDLKKKIYDALEHQTKTVHEKLEQ